MAFGYEYWIVYLPEFRQDTFLLLVHNPAGSTKLRDYSEGKESVLAQPKLDYVREATVWGHTRFSEDPHTVSGRDGERYWQARIAEYNHRYRSSVLNTDKPPGATGTPTIRSARSNTRIAGRAKRGSGRQLQDYVNLHQSVLDQAIISALPIDVQKSSPKIRWVSPLASQAFAEYRDAEFLSVLGLGEFEEDLTRFWPPFGPSWDALAILTTSLTEDLTIAVLVEAKSHVTEVYGRGCQAGVKSRELIEKSLALAKQWCGVLDEADWYGPLYQSANRIAHLYFLREILKRPAWLVNLYFLNDPICSTDQDEWDSALSQIKKELGLLQAPAGTIDVFLPALNTADDNREKASVQAACDAGPTVHELEADTSASDFTISREYVSHSLRKPDKEMVGSFATWRDRWSALAEYTGASVPDVQKRIERLISLWREPIPGEWQRGIDPQLLRSRYRRGDPNVPHNGEHKIEYEILQARFDQVTCFGSKLADGVNALPLCRDVRGLDRTGNVEADLLLLAENEGMFRHYLCEVKDQSNDAWYAAVETLRQLRLFVESVEQRRIFAHRKNVDHLPEEVPVTALVLAPESFYTARGKKLNAIVPTCELLSRLISECTVDLRLSVWDSSTYTISGFDTSVVCS